MTSAARKAVSGCTPKEPTKTATKTLVKAMTEPTERSMPPDRMTKVMPTAAMPKKALSVRRLPITRVDSMLGNCRTQSP
ncbi:hypothetical protein D3C73_1002260 [compost metagenome]